MADLNHIKVVLVEKQRTNKWLAKWKRIKPQYRSGAQIVLNRH